MPVFHRTKRWLALVSCLLLSSILFAACGENAPASILNTQGIVASDETFLFWVILIASVIVFVAVEGALLFAIIRYREKPGQPEPRQIHGNLKLEVVWTVVPTIALFIILFFTIRGIVQVAPESQPADPHTVEVEAIGHQWYWEFHYKKYNVTTADVMHVPANTVIHVDLFTNNVIHSFWVPALTGKTDLIPGHNNTKWFIANTTGSYVGECAEYCGTQHANMRFEVDVDSNDAFQTWISHQQQSAVAPASSLAQQGEALFKNGSCTTCHGIVGVNTNSFTDTGVVCVDTPANPTTDVSTPTCPLGPNLTHFGSRDLIAGGVLENKTANGVCDPNNPNLLTQCNLARWLNDPQGIKPGNDMVIGPLTVDQIKALVAYLESLK